MFQIGSVSEEFNKVKSYPGAMETPAKASFCDWGRNCELWLLSEIWMHQGLSSSAFWLIISTPVQIDYFDSSPNTPQKMNEASFLTFDLFDRNLEGMA